MFTFTISDQALQLYEVVLCLLPVFTALLSTASQSTGGIVAMWTMCLWLLFNQSGWVKPLRKKYYRIFSLNNVVD
jgi:uncharacterized membrane protein